MNKDDLTKFMKELLDLTRDKLCATYHEYDKRNTRIIFPKKRDNTRRISEQELRFAFVESFNETHHKYGELYYAVEVPTKDKYYFSGDKPTRSEKGQSAMFDFVIYDAVKRPIVFIEFKGNNPRSKDYEKDFCKLENPEEYKENPEAMGYFIEILKSSNDRTEENLRKKCKGHEEIHFKFLDLMKKEYLNIEL